MKHLLLTTIAAVVLVGCGESQQSVPQAEVEPAAEASQPEPQTAKVPDIDIHDAAFEGNIKAVKQHLAAGVDVNAKNVDGWTPLHSATEKSRNEVAELLIAEGADVNAVADNNSGYTPLHSARNEEIVELFIVNGANINAKDANEFTSLHYAAARGHKEVAELLITKGADVNAKDDLGKTPLDIANHPENPNDVAEIADLLRKHGGKTGVELKAAGK